MKAKFIYEKFTQDSDPIKDLQIGLLHEIRKWAKEHETLTSPAEFEHNEIDRLLLLSVAGNKYRYTKYLLELGANPNTSGGIHKTENGIVLRYACLNYNIFKLLLKHGAKIKLAFNENDIKNIIKFRRFCGYTVNDKIVNLIQQQVLKESLNEKFTQDSDPIKDLGIGLYAEHNFSSIKEAAEFLVDALPTITGESDLKKFLNLSVGGSYINSRLWDDKLWPYITEYIRIKNTDYKEWVGYVGNIAEAVRNEIRKRVE